jgi:hypothetical protein
MDLIPCKLRACFGKRGEICRTVVERSEVTGRLGDLGVDGRIILKSATRAVAFSSCPTALLVTIYIFTGSLRTAR